MIQMITPTYHATRARHPQIDLEADFVEGMRDHANALQAMLLYMQDTWDDMLKREQIRKALASVLATQRSCSAPAPTRTPRASPATSSAAAAAGDAHPRGDADVSSHLRRRRAQAAENYAVGVNREQEGEARKGADNHHGRGRASKLFRRAPFFLRAERRDRRVPPP
jgi:hypothetical protein